MKFIPHDYQKTAIEFIKKNKVAGLLLDMGLGKTVSTLTAANDLMYDEFEIGPVLVIAPKLVAETTWPDEVKQWEHLSHLRVSVISGNPQQRERAYDQQADIYTVSRDNVVWLVDLMRKRKEQKFDFLVIDESSSFKNHRSRRFRALKKIHKTFKRVVILTGTPAPNGLIDLWSQYYLLDSGERLGRTIGDYRRNHFKPGMSRGHVVYEWNIQDLAAEEAIHERISDITLSMKSKDFLTLPERVDNIIELNLTSKERKVYEELEREYILEVEGETVVADGGASLASKLLQLANGAIYVEPELEDEERTQVTIHDHKLDALNRIVDDAQGQPILVFYSFQSDAERIKKRFPKAEKVGDKDNVVKRWNDGEISMLLAHPASAGHGLNLQRGGHIAVWYGLTWSLELYEQANARLHRQGQDKTVVVHHLTISDTIEQKVMTSLQSKATVQDGLLQAIKDRAEKYDLLLS